MVTPQSIGKKQFLLGCILFIIIWFAGLIPIDKLFIHFMDQYNSEILRDTIIQFIGAGVILVLGYKIGVQSSMGLNKPSPSRTWFLIWPLVLLSIINIPESFKFNLIKPDIFLTPDPYTRIFFVISVGFVEEFLGRSMIGAGLLHKWGNTKSGIYKAAIVSSAIFGIAHIGNFFVYNYSLLASLIQIIVAFIFGIYCFALFVRTKSVWPGIIMHALMDLCAHLDIYSGTSKSIPPSLREFSATSNDFMWILVIVIPLGLLGLLALTKVKPKEIVQRSFVG